VHDQVLNCNLIVKILMFWFFMLIEIKFKVISELFFRFLYNLVLLLVVF